MKDIKTFVDDLLDKSTCFFILQNYGDLSCIQRRWIGLILNSKIRASFEVFDIMAVPCYEN